MPDLLRATDRGLWCEAGGFYVDPWRTEGGGAGGGAGGGEAMRAVVTHSHSDHARGGCGSYLTAASNVPILGLRLGAAGAGRITGIGYGEQHRVRVGDVWVSLHPAGHTRGSAMVLVERVVGGARGDGAARGERWLVTGDYKVEADGVSEAWGPVRCDVLVTESTFGLPIYRWRPQAEVFGEMNAWWRRCQEEGRTAVVFGYALGKAQRILAGLDWSLGPVLAHGAVRNMVAAYNEAGAGMMEPGAATREAVRGARGSGRGAIVVAPPSADGSPWIKGMGETSRAFASGWMMIRGTRRRRNMDRGFALSDHVDWPGLMGAIEASGAERVGVTHGYTEAVVRWLKEKGRDAFVVPTRYVGEAEGGAEEGEGGDEAAGAAGAGKAAEG